MTIEAEQSVIGSILIKPESYWQIADVLTANDFTGDNRKVYTVMQELALQGKTLDAFTVAEGGIDLGYLIDIQNATHSAANIKGHADIVVKHAQKRRLAVAGASIAKAETYSEAQRILATVAPAIGAKLSTMRDAAKSMYAEVLRRFEHTGTLVGLPTGIQGLDEITGGYGKGQLIIIAARPSMGKSAYANQCALGLQRPYIATLEMTREQLAERATANLGNFPYRWLRDPKESEEVWERLSVAMSGVSKLDWVIDDSSGITVDTIIARVRQAHMQKPLSAVFVDHLGIIARAGFNAAAELGQITTALKGLAKDLDIPVILLCQLNRKVEERADKRPMMSDLRDSGRIEEDADVIIFLYRPEYYGLKPEGFIEFIVAKCRDGETGSAWAVSRLANMRMESCAAPEFEVESVKSHRGFSR